MRPAGQGRVVGVMFKASFLEATLPLVSNLPVGLFRLENRSHAQPAVVLYPPAGPLLAGFGARV